MSPARTVVVLTIVLIAVAFGEVIDMVAAFLMSYLFWALSVSVAIGAPIALHLDWVDNYRDPRPRHTGAPPVLPRQRTGIEEGVW